MEKIVLTLFFIILGCLSGYVVIHCVIVTICETKCYPELLTMGAVLALMMVFYFLIDTIKFIWKGGQE